MVLGNVRPIGYTVQRPAGSGNHGKAWPVQTLLTIEGVADFLRLSKVTVYRMVQTGKIPASKVGTQWRSRRDEVESWLERNKNVKPDKGGSGGRKR